MGNIISMCELKTNKCPFEDYGCDETDYVPIDAILDQKVTIHAIREFENDKGLGVYVLVYTNGAFKYICTHSITITTKLTSENVKNILRDDSDDAIECVFTKRKSQKSDRLVYDVI